MPVRGTMLSAVLDSTVLVSAFLNAGGVSDALLVRANEGLFRLALAEEILAETERVLLTTSRIRRRYGYSDVSVARYIRGLRTLFPLVTELPSLTGIMRDPNDDMIVACAVQAQVRHIVTRDADLLSLGSYEGIAMTTPEAFMALLRQAE